MLAPIQQACGLPHQCAGNGGQSMIFSWRDPLAKDAASARVLSVELSLATMMVRRSGG